jgi:hypothetical protein
MVNSSHQCDRPFLVSGPGLGSPGGEITVNEDSSVELIIRIYKYQ